MKYASKDLINEHEGVLFALKILEKMAKNLQGQNDVEVKDIADIIKFFQLFADKCHHGKEEGLMFPAMERVGVPNEGGPIGQMLLEHNQGRKHIKDMEASIENGVLQASSFVNAATGYIELMRAHIEKENTVLFPLGDKLLPKDEQERLLEEFEEFEERVMGKGTHEKLHKLLHDFETKYLNS